MAISLVVAGVAVSQNAPRASAAPFTCNPTMYQVINGQLNYLNPIDGTYAQIGSTAYDNVNAVGYNSEDNYVYALAGNSQPVARNSLVRYEHDGSIINIGVPSGLDTTQIYNAGDFDEAGNLWVFSSGFGTGDRLAYRIDVSTNTATLVNSSMTGGGDMACLSGHFYGIQSISGSTPSNTFVNYDIASNTATNTVISALPASTYGATWATADGKVFIADNISGDIYEILGYNTGSPTASLVMSGDTASQNDGASCILANSSIPVDIDAVNDNYSSTPISTVTGGSPGNIFDNDTINGEPVEDNIPNVTVSVEDDDGLNGVTIDPDGDIHVPGGSTPGTYTLTYQICLAATPSVCDTATVTIVVAAVTAPPTTPGETDPDNNDPITAPDTGLAAAGPAFGVAVVALGVMGAAGMAVARRLGKL